MPTHVKDGDTYTLRVGKGSRTTFVVETVVSDAARIRGLSGRQALPKGRGMLFLFDSIARQGMWMIDMLFPLDIVWLDEHFTVLHITYGAPPCKSRTECPTYSSIYKVKYAIEMTAGQAEANGFAIGKQLSVLS